MLWKNFANILQQYYWKEHTFWSDGYFISTIGNVSEKILQKYINEQG